VTQTGGSTAVVEGGATDTVSVVLISQPTANVSVTVKGTADVSGSPSTLTFTSANWNVAQSATVAAVNDTLVEGPETASLSFATSSADTRYNGLSVAPVSVAITDNDQPPASTATALNAGGNAYTASDGTSYAADAYFSGGNKASTTAAIAGTADDVLYQTERYAKFLSYNIPVAPGDYLVTLKFAEFYFTGPGKRVFDVSVEGALVADNLDLVAQVGPKAAYDITLQAKVGADGNLDIDLNASIDNAKISAIKVVPVSGGTPSVPVTQSGGSTAVTEGATATDTVSLKLTSQPTADVKVTVNGTADVSASPSTLTFTSANWNVAQNVTVAAVNDTLVEGPETASLSFTTSSSDTRYNGLSVAPVSVAITDGDDPSVPGDGDPSVLDGSDDLTGGLGAQMWGGVAVSARDWDGAPALVTQGAQGLGVAIGRFDSQVDHDPVSGISESLRIDFDKTVDSATIQLGRMSASEGGGKGEVARWTALDKTGVLLGLGMLDPHDGTSVGENVYEFTIDSAAGLDTLVLSAVPYGDEAPTGTAGDSSDFTLQFLAYKPVLEPV
jgi:hypothetical protein